MVQKNYLRVKFWTNLNQKRFLRHLSFIQANHQVIVEKIDTADIPELFTYDRSRLVLYKVTRILSRPGTWTARPCVH